MPFYRARECECVLWCMRVCEKNRRLTDKTERKKSKKLIRERRKTEKKREGIFSDKMEKKTSRKKEEL